MIRMQNLNFKKTYFFILIVFFINPPLIGQVHTEDLKLADSLFLEKKYTQSFEIYQDLLSTRKRSSPAMLLKMAYIKEGLGDYSNALYYMNLYYLQTHNKRALKKMESIAKSHDLQGYDYTDFKFFMNIFYRYYVSIVFSLSGVVFILIAYMAYKKMRLRQKPGFSLFYLALTIVVLFYVVNFGRNYKKGIIITHESYLMDGPSAGAGLVAIADMGHRVSVIGKKDIWVKIIWEDDVAYIRENNLLQISKE